MNPDFWLDRWQKNSIGWHQPKANPFLVRYFQELSLSQGSRVFVPLCGKTLDIAWLLANGYKVVGAELSQSAIEQLFAELDVVPKIAQVDDLQHYSFENIDIFVGDIFNLNSDILGTVDAIYDRAALVALPEEIRSRYRTPLKQITNLAPQLLLTFDYDQSLMDGPPFSIDAKKYINTMRIAIT